MPWLVLLVSGVFEAVWATALGRSHGLTVLVPTIVFLVGLVISMLGLGWAVKHLPIGTAYAVWTGVGAALTVAYAMLSGDESASVWKLVFIAGIIAAVVGLRLVSESGDDPAQPAAGPGSPPGTPSVSRGR